MTCLFAARRAAMVGKTAGTAALTKQREREKAKESKRERERQAERQAEKRWEGMGGVLGRRSRVHPAHACKGDLRSLPGLSSKA